MSKKMTLCKFHPKIFKGLFTHYIIYSLYMGDLYGATLKFLSATRLYEERVRITSFLIPTLNQAHTLLFYVLDLA